MQSPCRCRRCVGPRRCLCVSGSLLIQVLLLDMVPQVHLADFEDLADFDVPMMDFTTSQHKQLDVAVCISGNLRTFIDPLVFGRIRPFHQKLGRVRDLQFFLYGTLTGGQQATSSSFFGTTLTQGQEALTMHANAILWKIIQS